MGIRFLFRMLKNVLNLNYGDGCLLCKYARKHVIVHFKRGNFKVHYLDKALF